MIPDYHPEVEILQFCLMPDHIHFILRVKSAMKKGIASVIRGFWQGAKKAGNLYASSILPNNIRPINASSVFPDNIRIHYTFSFVGGLMSWTKQTKKEPACSVV